MQIPVKKPPTIICQGSCSCYEHFILDGLGLNQNCSKADTFRQGGMLNISARVGGTGTQGVQTCLRLGCIGESPKGTFGSCCSEAWQSLTSPSNTFKVESTVLDDITKKSSGM